MVPTSPQFSILNPFQYSSVRLPLTYPRLDKVTHGEKRPNHINDVVQIPVRGPCRVFPGNSIASPVFNG